MLPTGMPTAVPSGPNSHTMPQNASSSPPGRTSRLRGGLSYLRSYASHHHHSHSPAAPTVVTAANASTASATTQISHGTSASAANPGGRRSSTVDHAARETATATNDTSSAATDEALSQPNTPANTSTMRGNPVVTATRTNGPTDPPAASIRFTPHMDIRASREALTFSPIERVLRTGQEVIRVGRYSERDNGPSSARDQNGSNTAPVGFKSKVVSRRHCEFWYDNGQWYVKDVKSSSGTFLNHIRLSAPGVESKAFPLYDGDVLQLGIDFKGGEEPIFRCVKIRVELNRAWQKGLNNFNMSAHKRIRNMAANSRPQGDTSSVHTSECSICLMSVAPCQSLFVAPCSHVWHFKCIRPLVNKSYPVFLCPNCRAIADLERDIEDDELDMYNLTNSTDDKAEHAPTGTDAHGEHNTGHHDHDDAGDDDPEDGGATGSAVGDDPTVLGGPGRGGLGDETAILAGEEGMEGIQQASHRNRTQHADNDSLDSRSSGENGYVRGSDNVVDSDDSGSGVGRRTAAASRGPMTPRNDVGPFVFDGAASRRGRGSEEALVQQR